MAKRSEIFKAMKANGWQLMSAGEACLLLRKGDHYEAELYLDSLNFSWGSCLTLAMRRSVAFILALRSSIFGSRMASLFCPNGAFARIAIRTTISLHGAGREPCPFFLSI